MDTFFFNKFEMWDLMSGLSLAFNYLSSLFFTLKEMQKQWKGLLLESETK